MRRIIPILMIGLWVFQPVWGQPEMNFMDVDSETYKLYEEKRWEPLISVGRKALRQHFDFYYLRVRLGIAFYNVENYAGAIRHFEAALIFNDNDPIILEYLYYSYIFMNRYQEASRLYFRYKTQLGDSKLTIRPKIVDYLGFQAGGKFSNHQVELGTETKNLKYVLLDFSLNIRGSLNVYQYGGGLANQYTEKFFQQGYLYNYYYTIRQFEYYARGSLLMGKGWLIDPAFHYIRMDSPNGFFNEYYWGLRVRKNFNKVHIGIEFSGSDIFGNRLFQTTPSLTYYPLGNTKWYMSMANTFLEPRSENRANHFSSGMGFKLFRMSWLEGFYAFGKSQYIAIDNGFIVYNSPDYLLSRGGLSFYQYFNNNTSLMISYQIEHRAQYLSEDPYKNQFIMVGLHIKL